MRTSQPRLLPIAGLLILLAGCTTPTARGPASADPTLEALCETPMERDFPKLMLASLYHRDQVHPPIQVTHQIALRLADGSIYSYLLPHPQNGAPSVMVPGLGRFPMQDGAPYVEYWVTSALSFRPPGADRTLLFNREQDWKRTDRAGVCFGTPAVAVPLSIRLEGDFAAAGLKRLLSARLSLTLDGKTEYLVVKPTEPLPTSLESALPVPPEGIQFTVALHALRGGGIAKTEPRRIQTEPGTTTPITITFSAADFTP